MNLTTGYPFGLINNGLPASYPKLESNAKTDVVIIGGGISGALTAYYLVRAGIDCLLVDGRTIGLGSTCASTSLLQYELDTPLYKLISQVGRQSAVRAFTLCSESIDHLEVIASKIKFPHFERRNSLYFAASIKDVDGLKREYHTRKNAGFSVDYLENGAIRKQYGFSSPGGILSRQGAQTDAYLLTHVLLQNSIQHGLKVFDRTRVSKIEYQRNGVKLITMNGPIITARRMVNASGYEITEFIDKKIVSLHSTYALVSENISPQKALWKDKALLWNTADPYLYIRMTRDNRIMVGGRDELFYNPARRDKLINRKSTLLKKDFAKLFPHIDLLPEFRWAGTFGSTRDALPYIGMYDKTPHTYYALGFGGNGITFSLIAAKIIRDLMTGRKNKDVDLFSFNR